MIERDIERLWGQFESVLGKLEDENIDSFIDKFGQRIVETSFSQRLEEPFCGYGGLLEFSLNLAKTARSMSAGLNINVINHSVIKAALFCDLGRIGDEYFPRLIEQESDWHKEKLGQYFTWHESASRSTVNDLSLYHLQNAGIKLSYDEWIAIKVAQGGHLEENKFYAGQLPALAQLIQSARELVLNQERLRIRDEKNSPF